MNAQKIHPGAWIEIKKPWRQECGDLHEVKREDGYLSQLCHRPYPGCDSCHDGCAMANTVSLVDVYADDERYFAVLYELLKERAGHESISHHEMPTWDQHAAFVKAKPYKAWYYVHNAQYVVGAVFLAEDRAVGVGILRAHRRKGLGKRAVQELLRIHPGPVTARIAPGNIKSQELFQKLGFQRTHEVWEKK